MRLFVAVDLDETARPAIARLQQALASRLASDRALRWVRPDRMHLTVMFLGEIAEAGVAPLIGVLSRPLDAKPFPVTLAGVGVFPSRGAPQVLWLGAAEGADRLAALETLVAERLAPLGIDRERRPFHPHLTLARWRGRAATRVAAADRVRVTREPSDRVARFDVDHVTLYASRLSPAGPTYLALARANLT
jgi:2'-5' RNA ligase